MIECNYCHFVKEQDSFRRYKKDPLCTECFNNEKKLKYRIDNPISNLCIKCGISKDIKPFVKNTNCCKDCKKLYREEYYNNNKTYYIEYSKVKSKTPDRKNKQKDYQIKNKEVIKEYQKEYRILNREKIKETERKYQVNLRLNNPQIIAWRTILKDTIRRFDGKKSDKTINLLGYSPDELKNHIESLFLDGMSWDNWGEWHIDHKKPVSKFDKEAPMSVVNSLDNLQPLWAIDNLIKKDKYEL